MDKHTLVAKHTRIAKNLEDMGAETLTQAGRYTEVPTLKCSHSDMAAVLRHISTLYYELAQLRRDFMVNE